MEEMNDYICKTHQWRLNNGDTPCPYCELDRLKGELEDTIKYCKPYGGNPRVCTGMQAHKSLERQLAEANEHRQELQTANIGLRKQLAEARAENERLNSVDHYACALCPDVAQARQEAARSIIKLAKEENIFNTENYFIGLITKHFKLEG